MSSLASYHMRENQVLAGIGYDTVWTGARPLDDERDGEAVVRGSVTGPFYAAAAGIEGGRVDELQLVLATGILGLWAGRRQLGYASAHGGGIVLDAARFDAIGGFVRRPLRLPLLGATRFETHLSRIDNVLNRDGVERNTEPWFWTARAAFEPHARLRIGINRGMIFGGEANVPVTAGRLLKNLIGIYSDREGEDSFAAQIVSVDVRYRLRTGALPIALYLDWGADDASGAWWDVPGIVGGIEVSTLPHADVSFGVERTEFVRNFTNNSNWYQNAWFRGSWADDGRVLGHPLGGHGKEWRVFVAGGSAPRGISADLAVYSRWRGVQNLFAPQRQGSSAGAAIAADARVNRALRLVLSGEIERGREADAWTAARGRAGIRYVF
ncbi:MAG: capsule assembly Wzi family protein [Gemmatimonadota bacterium]